MELLSLTFSYISANSYISGSNFPSSKTKNNPPLKNFLCFEKWIFLATSLKSYYISEGT